MCFFSELKPRVMNFGNSGFFNKPEGLWIDHFVLSSKTNYKNMVKPVATSAFIPKLESGGCHTFVHTYKY